MKSYIVTFYKEGSKKYTRFNELEKATLFADYQCRKNNCISTVQDYDTDDVEYTADPKIHLDKKLRI